MTAANDAIIPNASGEDSDMSKDCAGSVSRETCAEPVSAALVEDVTRVNTHSSANEDPKNSVLVIDGEAEVDDMLLAACFANYENAALERIQSASCNALKTFPEKSYQQSAFDLDALLAKHDLQEWHSDDDNEAEEVKPDNPNAEYSDSEASSPLNEPLLDADSEDDEFQQRASTKKFSKHSGLTPTADNADAANAMKPPNDKFFWSLEPVVVQNLPSTVSDSAQLTHIGSVRSVVGRTVVVDSQMSKRTLDLGSVLCTEKREVMGTVSDTFGPVTSPLYVVCGCGLQLQEGDPVYADLHNSTFLLDDKSRIPDYLRGAFEAEISESALLEDVGTEPKTKVHGPALINPNRQPCASSTRAKPQHNTRRQRGKVPHKVENITRPAPPHQQPHFGANRFPRTAYPKPCNQFNAREGQVKTHIAPHTQNAYPVDQQPRSQATISQPLSQSSLSYRSPWNAPPPLTHYRPSSADIHVVENSSFEARMLRPSFPDYYPPQPVGCDSYRSFTSYSVDHEHRPNFSNTNNVQPVQPRYHNAEPPNVSQHQSAYPYQIPTSANPSVGHRQILDPYFPNQTQYPNHNDLRFPSPHLSFPPPPPAVGLAQRSSVSNATSFDQRSEGPPIPPYNYHQQDARYPPLRHPPGGGSFFR